MIKRTWLVVLMVLCLTGAAWAQMQGPTMPPIALDEVEILYRPIQPVYQPAEPAPIIPAEAGPIGANLLNYFREFTWSIDPTVGDLTEPDLPELTADMQAAVDIAPDWIKPALARKLMRIDADLAADLADLINDPEDELYTDELAFCVAYLSETDLEHMDDPVSLLADNVRLIYEYDAFLDYVEIVEVGTFGEGDYGTTLTYRVEVPLIDDDDGPIEDFEIPMEIYYWFVVHPRLSDERPEYVKPSSGGYALPENDGIFWREYLPWDIEGEQSYATTMYMQGIDEADLQNLSPSALGYISDRTIHNLEIIYHGDTRNVVFTEFAYGSGTIYASTLRIHTAYTDNDCPLLEQLLDQGNGDILLPEDSPIAVISDLGVSTAFQDALTAIGRWDDVTVIDSTTLLGYDEGDWTTFKDTYEKVVVLPEEPLALYEAIADATVKENLESFASGWGVLELHLVPQHDVEAKGLADLTFPGNFGFTDSTTDSVTVYGRPLLFDVLEDIDKMWDGEPHSSMPGDRPLWENADALQAVGNWVGKNTLDNINERFTITGGSAERSVQPVRIAYNHYGNCGELQDLGTAAKRTALIPALAVSNTNEDHVWSEFYHDGEWHVFQNSWSNADTQIDKPGGGHDTEYGGGKNTSFMQAWWGDGRLESVSPRYSQNITLEFEITDVNGDPVPDARIEVYSEMWPDKKDKASKLIGHWMLTDQDGHAEVLVGDYQNYYVYVNSAIGEYPKQGGSVTQLEQIVDETDAEPDNTFTFEHQFDDPLIAGTVEEPSGDVNDTLALHVQLEVTHRFGSTQHPFSGVYANYESPDPLVDVFLVNDDNYSEAKNNSEFTAAWAAIGVDTIDETIYPPTAENWNLLVKSHSAPSSDLLLDVTVTVEGDPWTPPADDDDDDDDDDNDDNDDFDDDDDDDDDDGCGCQA